MYVRCRTQRDSGCYVCTEQKRSRVVRNVALFFVSLVVHPPDECNHLRKKDETFDLVYSMPRRAHLERLPERNCHYSTCPHRGCCARPCRPCRRYRSNRSGRYRRYGGNWSGCNRRDRQRRRDRRHRRHRLHGRDRITRLQGCDRLHGPRWCAGRARQIRRHGRRDPRQVVRLRQSVKLEQTARVSGLFDERASCGAYVRPFILRLRGATLRPNGELILVRR